jgi:hypothetical protein
MSWAIVVGYLAFNSSYYMWWGGQSMGARHLIPMLPFMFLPILAAMRRESRMRGVVMLAGAISVMMNVPAIAVGPEMKTYCDVASLLNPDISWNLTSAWLVDVFPSFWRGDIAVTPFGFLPGILPIAPLALLWAASLWQAWRWGIEDAGEAASV